MRNINKKTSFFSADAFTLIELLAVIIILAIVALIATPIILNVIEDSRKSANMSQAEILYSGAQTLYASGLLNEELSKKFNGEFELYNFLETTNEKPEYGSLKITSNGKIMFSTYIDGYCYSSALDKTELIVEEMTNPEDCIPKTPYKEVLLNGADPILSKGLIPINIASDGTITVADIYEKWYSYEEKMWANVAVVNDQTIDLEPGTIISDEKIADIYVYIPRYTYQIFDNTNSNTTINIKFQSNIDSKNTLDLSSNPNDVLGQWLTHPAFTYTEDDGKIIELNGIWVSKFEYNGTGNINVNTVASKNVKDLYYGIQNLNNQNGLDETSDIHMIKNIEWGAITYLSQSIYGVCTSNESCDNKIIDEYRGANWKKLNKLYTNHNITGIYDMVGNHWELTMSSYKTDDVNLAYSYSEFTQQEINDIPLKYIDIYKQTTGSTEKDKALYSGLLGDATKETYNWNSTLANFIEGNNNWFIRGNYTGDSNNGIFSYQKNWGGALSNVSTRQVLWTE